MYQIHTLIHFWLREVSGNHENLTNQNQTDQPFNAFLSVDDITMRTLTFLLPLAYSYAAQHNTGIARFTMENIKRLCRQGLANVTVKKWANCVRHVREKVEKHYKTIHGVLDDVVEQMVIN